MINIRKWFCVASALALALLAFPSFAQQSQNKYYTLSMSVPTQGQGTTNSTVTATLKNVSPQSSSSTFSSVDLYLVDLNWVPVAPVTVKRNGIDVGSVDLSRPGHIVVSNLGPVKPGDTLTITFNVNSSSCGDATWNASVWSGSLITTGNIFSRPPNDTSAPVSSVACGEGLACDLTSPDTVEANGVFAQRSPYNEDGTTTGLACGGTNAYISNTSLTYAGSGLLPNTVHFRWDGADTTFSSAVFEYTVPFGSLSFGPSGMPVVGWLYADGGKANKPGADPNNSGNPVVFIDALPCLVNPGDSVATPPAPYGVLQTRLDATSTTVKVDTGGVPPPTTIPVGGFPIVIGGERMQVIAISSNGWTVEARSSGVPHPKYALVMSSPLPLLTAAVVAPPYEVGKPAQVCMSGGDENSTDFIDNSDAWVGAE